MELIIAVEIDERDVKLLGGGPIEETLHRTVGALDGLSIKNVLNPATGYSTAEQRAHESGTSHMPLLRAVPSS